MNGGDRRPPRPDPHVGRTFRFVEHATFLVGRSPQAHFQLTEKDPHLSRLHLVVEVNPPLVRAMNMSGVNPTLVNGVKIDHADLNDGDRITIGTTELVLNVICDLAGDNAATLPLPPKVSGLSTDTAPDVGQFADLADTKQGTAPLPGCTSGPPLSPDYRIDPKWLGKGGMGVVYRAVHEPTGEAVAVKTILPKAAVSPAILARFVREVDILRQLDHPGVVRFRDTGTAAGCAWLAMELVDGRDAQAAADAGPLAVGRAVGWVVQALEALAHAHARGFVHRDVKPHNLLVAAAPGGEVVKVADFGLARAYEASPLSGLTLTGQAGGTPPFMPPEQVVDLRGVKPSADQYAAAATLYRLLAGRHVYPRMATVGALFSQILTTDPDPPDAHRPDLPAGLVAAVMRALSREPNHRFPDCTAFAAALRPFVS